LEDFNRLKRQVLDLTSLVETQAEKQRYTEQVVARLEAENVKLRAEMKILRDEHTEVLHLFHNER